MNMKCLSILCYIVMASFTDTIMFCILFGIATKLVTAGQMMPMVPERLLPLTSTVKEISIHP